MHMNINLIPQQEMGIKFQNSWCEYAGNKTRDDDIVVIQSSCPAEVEKNDQHPAVEHFEDNIRDLVQTLGIDALKCEGMHPCNIN